MWPWLNFSEYAGHGYDKKHALHVWDICFWQFKLLSNTTPRFLAGADGFVSLPRIKHGKLFKNFSR